MAPLQPQDFESDDEKPADHDYEGIQECCILYYAGKIQSKSPSNTVIHAAGMVQIAAWPATG